MCFLGAKSGILCGFDTDRKRGGIIASSNLDPLALGRYNSRIQEYDVWPARLSHASSGVAQLTHEMVPDHILTRSKFYRHFLRSLNVFYGCEGFFANDRNDMAMIGLYRPAKDGCFSTEDADLLTSLFPYLRNMLAIERQNSLLTTLREALFKIFDLLSFGVFVLNRSGEVIAMNGAAKQIVMGADGFVLKYKTLVPVRSWQRSEFRSLVMDALDPDRQAAHKGAVMKVFRGPEQRSLEVLVMPLNDQGCNGQLKPIDSEPASMVLVCNPDVRMEVPAEALVELYSLTPAEARMTAALVRGKRISEVAKDFNLSEQTLRGELRSVFQKTETNRQAELVSVILAGVASFTDHA